jgi:hypothetical protein
MDKYGEHERPNNNKYDEHERPNNNKYSVLSDNRR